MRSAPTVAGAIELASGNELRLRYRLVLHDGPANPQRLDELWAAYAAAVRD